MRQTSQLVDDLFNQVERMWRHYSASRLGGSLTVLWCHQSVIEFTHALHACCAAHTGTQMDNVIITGERLFSLGQEIIEQHLPVPREASSSCKSLHATACMQSASLTICTWNGSHDHPQTLAVSVPEVQLHRSPGC